MSWKENIFSATLAINVAVCPMAEANVNKDYIHDQINPQTKYEQRIETPEHLRAEALTDMSKNIKDMTSNHLKAKGRHNKIEEITERSNSPPTYSDSPPPTKEEIRADRMEERLEEIRSKEAELSKLQNHRAYYPNSEVQKNRLKNSIIKANEFFKREYNVSPEQAPEVIKELREQATAKRRELKPPDEKSKILEEQQRERRVADRQTKENITKTYDRTRS